MSLAATRQKCLCYKSSLIHLSVCRNLWRRKWRTPSNYYKARRKHKTMKLIRSSHPKCSIKKGVVSDFVKFKGKYLCRKLFFKKLRMWGLQLYEKETLGQLFFCEFCEISKSAFFTEHLLATASDSSKTVALYCFINPHYNQGVTGSDAVATMYVGGKMRYKDTSQFINHVNLDKIFQNKPII